MSVKEQIHKRAREEQIPFDRAFARELLFTVGFDLEPISLGTETVRHLVENAVTRARKHGITTQKLDLFKERRDELHNSYLKKKISYRELQEALPTFPNVGISFDSMEDFRQALKELKYDPDDVQHVVDHEKAHYTEALKYKKYKINPRLHIDISLDDDGAARAHPATIWDRPLGMTEEEEKAMDIAIIRAVGKENYSIHDQRALEGLEGPAHDHDHSPETNHDPKDIAASLLDYNTGEVNSNYSVDLLPSYVNIVTQVQENLDQFAADKPTIILSPVAHAMLDNIASSANSKSKELALSLQGGYILGQGGQKIFVVAFAAPASDFVDPDTVSVDIRDDIRKDTAAQLAKKTGLENFFSEHGKPGRGLVSGVVHIHHRHLPEASHGNPSGLDRQQAEEWFRNQGENTPYWGVSTKTKDNQLLLTIYRTYQNTAGEMEHEELPVIIA